MHKQPYADFLWTRVVVESGCVDPTRENSGQRAILEMVKMGRDDRPPGYSFVGEFLGPFTSHDPRGHLWGKASPHFLPSPVYWLPAVALTCGAWLFAAFNDGKAKYEAEKQGYLHMFLDPADLLSQPNAPENGNPIFIWYWTPSHLPAAHRSLKGPNNDAT